jgi:hypothetical protein
LEADAMNDKYISVKVLEEEIKDIDVNKYEWRQCQNEEFYKCKNLGTLECVDCHKYYL